MHLVRIPPYRGLGSVDLGEYILAFSRYSKGIELHLQYSKTGSGCSKVVYHGAAPLRRSSNARHHRRPEIQERA